VGIDDWREYVRSDSEMLRPTDSARMVGDASKARNVLGWEPTKTFDQVVRAMIEFDMTEEIAA
jgi:GDPmannose 4,6-dehydratase